jgi:hypothetical protein
MSEHVMHTRFTGSFFRVEVLFCFLTICAAGANAQRGAQPSKADLSGHVVDSSGALIRGARVELCPTASESGLFANTDSAGRYVFTAADSGAYVVIANAAGFASFRSEPITLEPGTARTFDIRLAIADQLQQIEVPPDNPMDTDPGNNGTAFVLKGHMIDELPLDAGELSQELDALAGSQTPELRIDGFSGGTIPPRDTIREIHINQDPYSARNDSNPSNGMIEVSTKPGTGQLHGQLYAFGSTSELNSLPPFVIEQPAYHTVGTFGNLSGPLSKRASFFADGNYGANDVNSIVNAMTLVDLVPTAISEAVASPSTSDSVSARIDTGFGKKSTLVVRYNWDRGGQSNGGIGNLSLASQGFHNASTTQTLQVSNSQLISANIMNDTRFQYIRSRIDQTPVSGEVSIVVQGAFNGGGSPLGSFRDNQDHYELQNYVSEAAGKHFFSYGGRLRVGRDANYSRANYNGQFIFSTFVAYHTAEQNLQACISQPVGLPLVHLCQTYGASQYSQTTGTPNIAVTLADAGLFFQDDWKARPNLTVSAGLRFETQNHIADHADWAPRFGIAYAFGGAKGKPQKYTVRGGAGVFYSRFASSNVLQAERQNGVTQQQFVISAPGFFSTNFVAPTNPSTLGGGQVSSATYQVSPVFHAPYFISGTASLQRSVGRFGTVTASYLVNRGIHSLLTRNINAPLPGTYNPNVPGSGTRPLGGTQDVYEYDSVGFYNSNRFSANFFLRFFKSKVAVYGYYLLRFDKTDDGSGGFPSNSYDIGADYGRSPMDTRHLITAGGNANLPWGIQPAIFLIASTGAPFNIVVGQDLNGDSQFNDRPAFATDLSRPSVVQTRYGNFDTSPIAGQTIIPINYGQGPGAFDVNLALRKSIRFGPQQTPPAGNSVPNTKAPIQRKFGLDLYFTAQNALNHVNLAPPVGTLNSPLFGKSVALASGFGPPYANRNVVMDMAFRF